MQIPVFIYFQEQFTPTGHPVHSKQESLFMGQMEHVSVHLANIAARRTGKCSRNEEWLVEYHFFFFS